VTEKELDILILLLGRNLHPALIGEMSGEEEMKVDEETGAITTEKKVVFRRDVTERLKVLNSLLSLRHQVEKNKDDGKDGEQPLLKIVASRDLMSGGRLGILIGQVQNEGTLQSSPRLIAGVENAFTGANQG
jgi:head-tail adaptor